MKTSQKEQTIVRDTIEIFRSDTVTQIVKEYVYNEVKDRDSVNVNTFKRNDTVFIDKTTYRERNNYIYINKSDSTDKRIENAIRHVLDSIHSESNDTVIQEKKSVIDKIRDRIVDIIIVISIFIIAIGVLVSTHKKEDDR